VNLPEELTVTEAMKFSGFSRVHLYNLMNADRIKHRRAKMRAAPVLLLIERASLEAYMQERRSVTSVEK